MSHAERVEPTRRKTGFPNVFLQSRSGRVAAAWCLGGGITAGGFLVAAVTLSGSVSSSIAAPASTVLFALGASAGFVHGAVLGYLARDLTRTRSEVAEGLGVAVLLLLPTAPVAWLMAVLVAFTSASMASRQVSLIAGSAMGWVVSIGVCALAAREGWNALGTAFSRWPERRTGTLITVAVLAVLTLTFFRERPAIWFTDVRVTGPGAVILALGATAWIAFPVVLGVLHTAHRIHDRVRPSEASHAHTDPRT